MLIMRHGSIHDVLRVGGGEIGCCRTREVMYVHGFERIEAITKFSVRDEVRFAQTGLKGILNANTAANNALKLAAKSGEWLLRRCRSVSKPGCQQGWWCLPRHLPRQTR
jgi:hypothetical protein